MTEIFFTATDDFHEIEVIRFMALPYDIEDSVLLSTWSQIKSDPEHEIRTENRCLLPTSAKGELQSRLDDPEVDDMENSRPDAYKIGWRSACDKIAVVDASFDALPDFVADHEIPPTVGCLLEYAENEVERLRSERKLAFLTRRTWSDENRCEHWTWKGRESCCWAACRYLDRVDNDIPSIDLSKILRKHSSVQKMNKFIEEHRQEKHVQSRSAINELVQEYSQRLRANVAVENIIADHKKRGAK